MNFKQFCEKIYKAISEFYGEQVKVEIREVKKNNNVMLTGLLMTEGDGNVSPSLYLDSFFEEYEYGKEIDKIITEIIGVYERVRKNPKVDMNFFNDYSAVKERICYKFVNYQKNADLLKKCPHIRYLNLAIIFYYAYSGPVLGQGSIIVQNIHKEEWKVSTEELFGQANDNTKRLFPCKILGIEDLLAELTGKDPGDESIKNAGELSEPMYIVTNTIKYMGAISIMYPGVLKKLADKSDANLFILPSSVHEFIVIPDIGQDTNYLHNMVMEVNQTQVAEEEILADSVYYFDRISEKIELLA